MILSWVSFILMVISTASAGASVPRSEVPDPLFARTEARTLNLNGEWEFTYSHSKTPPEGYASKILVPFTRETLASGLNDTEFSREKETLWYRKHLQLPSHWEPGDKLILNFGAVNYQSEIWVNGKKVGAHIGGYSPFQIDISAVAGAGANSVIIEVRAHNPLTSMTTLRGKQQIRENEGSIFYQTSTGIRETVYLESVPSTHIRKLKLLPVVNNNLKSGALRVRAVVANPTEKSSLTLVIRRGRRKIRTVRVPAESQNIDMVVSLDKLKLWSVEKPELYDLEFQLHTPQGQVDRVRSYTGFKKLDVQNGKVYLNGKLLYQQLVLDQGYYPRSGYTPESLAEAEKDILAAKEAGFNGARFHQQTAPAMKRSLADRHGFLFWAELPSARDLRDWRSRDQAKKELDALIESVNNNPACIGITVFNETWGIGNNAFSSDTWNDKEKAEVQLEFLRHIAPKLRPDVLISLNDGWEMVSFVDEMGRPLESMRDLAHLRGRVVTAIHDYPHYADELVSVYGSYNPEQMRSGSLIRRRGDRKVFVAGFGYDKESPVFFSEFGGVSTHFDPGPLPQHMMAYGPVERDPIAYANRVAAQLRALGELKLFGAGYTYTQLEDTGIEVNGILKNRQPKVPLDIFKKQQNIVAKMLGAGRRLPLKAKLKTSTCADFLEVTSL